MILSVKRFLAKDHDKIITKPALFEVIVFLI